MKLILNMPFVTLNEYINTERTNKYKAAKIKKQQTNAAAYLAMEQDFKLEDKKYNIICTWYKPNNRQDHDNISFALKFVQDALVQSGALKNDSPKYINNITHKFELDKTRSYISCVVEFIEHKNN